MTLVHRFRLQTAPVGEGAGLHRLIMTDHISRTSRAPSPTNLTRLPPQTGAMFVTSQRRSPHGVDWSSSNAAVEAPTVRSSRESAPSVSAGSLRLSSAFGRMTAGSLLLAARSGCVQTFRRPQLLLLPVFPLKVGPPQQHRLTTLLFYGGDKSRLCALQYSLETCGTGRSAESRLRFFFFSSPFTIQTKVVTPSVFHLQPSCVLKEKFAVRHAIPNKASLE